MRGGIRNWGKVREIPESWKDSQKRKTPPKFFTCRNWQRFNFLGYHEPSWWKSDTLSGSSLAWLCAGQIQPIQLGVTEGPLCPSLSCALLAVGLDCLQATSQGLALLSLALQVSQMLKNTLNCLFSRLLWSICNLRAPYSRMACGLFPGGGGGLVLEAILSYACHNELH